MLNRVSAPSGELRITGPCLVLSAPPYTQVVSLSCGVVFTPIPYNIKCNSYIYIKHFILFT